MIRKVKADPPILLPSDQHGAPLVNKGIPKDALKFDRFRFPPQLL